MEQRTRTSGRIIGFAFLGGLLFWLVDTVLDALIFYQGSFLDLLILDVPQHEIWVRVAALLLFLLAGLLLARMQSGLEQAHETLRRYEVIVASSTDMLALLDKRYVYLAANDAYLGAFGLTRDDLVGHTVSEVFGEEFFKAVIRPPAERCLSGEEVHYQEWFDFPDTGQMYMDITYFPYVGQSKEVEGFVVNGRNITDRKRLEEQFHHSQRMEVVGRLAGGIAHDFNNVLTVISGNAELGLGLLPEDDPLRERLATIEKAARHAGDLTSKLLAFGRKQIIAPKVLDLNLVLADMYPVLRRLITEEINLAEEQGSGLGMVMMDPGQLEQILVNLVVNASEAMPEGGQLTIETAMVELGEEYIRTHPHAQQGPHVMLAVSDTGQGIVKEDLNHIFEPFYTTKSAGSGLGLATVFGIVKQNEGSVEVYSEEGVGTSFKIYFPIVDAPADTYESESESPAMPEGTEIILLVEDQEAVRKLAAGILTDLGYDVHDFADPGTTVEFCRRFDGSIDLLLTDVVMPGESGKALGERLQKIQPSMQVLYMSGYTDNSIVKHGVLDEGVNFLPKPFTIHALAQKVRSVLDGTG